MFKRLLTETSQGSGKGLQTAMQVTAQQLSTHSTSHQASPKMGTFLEGTRPAAAAAAHACQ
jgi:hypothetical protein